MQTVTERSRTNARALPARPRRAVRAIRWPQIVPTDFTEGVLPERVFLGILSLERKRAERSARQFALLLLDAEDLESGNERDAALHCLMDALASVRRETDLIGWYRQECILGLIFTEIDAQDLQPVMDMLTSKVARALREHLDEETLSRVRFTVQAFPGAPIDADWESRRGTGTRSLYPDLVHHARARKSARMVKRVMDVLGSALAVTVLSPIIGVIAAAIKLTSNGPVFFVQERLGQYGKPFKCMKFRTMYTGNNPTIHVEYVKKLIRGEAVDVGTQNVESVFKIQDDPRVTPLGYWLRKSSLDELPQFLNVLMGQMSLVGPRPPVRYEFEAYDIWHRRRVFEVKPGITGLWQVKGRSQVSFDEMVRLDLRYARSWSIWMDIQILLQTPGAVFSGKGAY